MNIEYPTDLALKIIKNEASGTELKNVVIVVPTIVRPGEEFSVKIALTAENGCAVIDYSDAIEVTQKDAGVSFNVTFKKGQPALAKVNGITIGKEGIYRFESTVNGNTCYSNPVYCSSSYANNIYWGDPHIHTALSNCNASRCRSCNFSFNAARHLSCLDWAGAADHVSNGRCELARWKEEVAVSNAYNDEPEFVTLPAYEASLSGGCGGDNNVYMSEFVSLFVDEHDGGNSKTLCEKLGEKAKEEGFDYFVVPHHTTRPGKHGEIPDEIYPGKDLMPVVEIHSKWGTSEYRGNPMALHDLHDGPSYAVDLLEKGLALGFIGGTDTHCTLTFGYGKGFEADHIDWPAGITAVKCDDLSRRSVFDSIKNRNCYAAAGERIFLDVKVNGTDMGQFTKKAGKNELSIIAAGQADIDTVEIIRNGEVIKTFEPDGFSFTGNFEDTAEFDEICLDSKHLGKFVYYYVRVRCKSGSTAWSSPVWIS